MEATKFDDPKLASQAFVHAELDDDKMISLQLGIQSGNLKTDLALISPICRKLALRTSFNKTSELCLFVVLAICIHVLVLYLLNTTVKVPNSTQKAPKIHATLYHLPKILTVEKDIVTKSEDAKEAERTLTNSDVLKPLQTQTHSVVKKASTNIVDSNKQISTQTQKKARTPLSATETLSALAEQVREKSLESSFNDWHEKHINRKNHLPKSSGKYLKPEDVAELTLKSKKVDCNGAIGKSAAVISGLLGGRIKCDRLPSLNEFIEKDLK